MTYTIQNWNDYYNRNFIDPLYAQYMTRPTSWNPFTLNTNELSQNKGTFFKRQNIEYPCPMGYVSDDLDGCIPIKAPASFFYSPKYSNILKFKSPHNHIEFNFKYKPVNMYSQL